jgi:uncharacterized DUF497 family protein
MINLELPEPIIFDWDYGNQTKSLKKHGITAIEAEEVFLRLNIIIPDQRHSHTEARFNMYGPTAKGKILFIAFTIRENRVRIISARNTDKKERQYYEEQIEKTS